MGATSLGRIYKRCLNCNTYIPRLIWNKETKKNIKNEKHHCEECLGLKPSS